ncbi:MAG TPA: pyridoxamine 5'-phosphate oxidase family protein [Candidatus Saccharimonadales bacterium]|nr:pyridoxamine 5'-phosphate oxidase family protein [Candidatus Saccharimonadales bacterium]
MIDIEKIIREYIPEVVHMSLATVREGKPWVCELHFAYDEDLNLYFRSLASRRHSQEIAENPHVAGNIVRQHSLEEYPLGVYFEGTAKRLEPGDEQSRAFQLIKERLKAGDDILAEAQREDGHQFYKITVTNWYVFGRLEGDKGQKYQLAWNGGKHE